MALQHHDAAGAGPHLDLRLVDKAGRAHSWAIPRGYLAKPGKKVLAIPQPTHTRDYAARAGVFEIDEGYGKGRVTGGGLRPVEVVRSRPGAIRFNVYGGPREGNQEFALISTPRGTLLHNITSTAESGVRGEGGHPIPRSKPTYREIPIDRISFHDPTEVHQAKVDGAHVTFHLRGGRNVKTFSFRPTERATGIIEHTHKIPDFHELVAPSSLSGTVLRGELYAADKKTGKALPAEQVGGLLNAGVWRSREKQRELNAEIKPVIFDVVRYRGQDYENRPYADKLKVLEEVQQYIPRLRLPPTATTLAEKARLLSRIQAGKEPITKEGIISWNVDKPHPTKAKIRPDVDVEVVGVTAGKGGNAGRMGALQVKLPGKEAITNVGTGFSHQVRADIASNPERYIGRVARVETQQIFPSGKLRAPSFKEWHIEKGKQPEEHVHIKQATIESKQVRAGTPVVDSLNLFERKLLPGDIILSKIGDPNRAPGSSKALSGTIKAYDVLSGAKHPGWGHTALYVGDGKIQHLYDKKFRRKTLVDSSPDAGASIIVKDTLNVFDTQGYDLLALRPKSGGEQAVATLNELAKRPLTMTSGKFVRNLLRTGLTPIGGKDPHDAVCSGIIGAAFPPNAIDASRKPLSLRPKDMLESRKVKHLVAYENPVEGPQNRK